MTTIYVDPSVAGAPDAVDHLRHFVETGHDVVILGDGHADLARSLGVRTTQSIAGRIAAGAWLVTADPAGCADRRPGLRTLLVGPRSAPSPRPAPRCDAEARDLASAVLEILSRDAMG
jgi:hypothetical protein